MKKIKIKQNFSEIKKEESKKFREICFRRELQNKLEELKEQSEKISQLVSEIGKLNIKIQDLEKTNESLRHDLAYSHGHMREKENKINMIRSILGK